MSDGMSDASALDELASRLYEATHQFLDVLRSVDEGRRGWGVNVLAVANKVLEPRGYRLIKRVQDEVWR